MLLQVPLSMIEERHDGDPHGDFSDAAFGSPSCFEFVAAGEEECPASAHEVGDEDDKGPLDGDVGRFELERVSM